MAEIAEEGVLRPAVQPDDQFDSKGNVELRQEASTSSLRGPARESRVV